MNHLPHTPRRLVLALAAALPALSVAAPGTTSAYRTDTQHSQVQDATSKGIGTVNMITCIMSAMRPEALVNQPAYLALVDEAKCDSEGRSSSSNSGADSSATAAPSYTNALVNSTRISNDDPMRVKAWIENSEEGQPVTIFVNISATSAPTTTNPYGVFRIDFCGKGDATPCMMNGFLEGTANGITFFEQEQRGPGETSSKALVLSKTGAESGSGKLSFNEGAESGSYSFAYNDTLFRRSDGSNDQCFSRDASDAATGYSVWRYGLYDSDSGAAVTRNSGFPIEFDAGGKTYHGYMGYWGLSVPGDAPAPANGATVQRVQYQQGSEPTKTPYTVMRADGRLMKYIKHTKKLNTIDKIKFNTWVSQVDGFYSGAQANHQYEMYWDDAAKNFKATGMVDCGNNGCQTRTLDAEQAVPASYFAGMGGVRAYSQALGGEMYIPLRGISGTVTSTDIDVIYRSQDLVYPADMPASLTCISNCPTQESMAAFFQSGSQPVTQPGAQPGSQPGSLPGSSVSTPYTAGSAMQFGPANDTVSYTLDATTGLLKDGANQAVTFTDREAMQQKPQYAQGVRSGRLFAGDASAALCGSFAPGKYCEYKVEDMDEYYQWETGANNWNQFAALKDGSNHVVQFDAPLQVNYSVPSGAAFGDYAGKSLVLQYGGFGDLWGIPGHCVSAVNNATVSCDQPNSRYVAAFAIPFDETLGRVSTGNASYLVKWLDREIRFARKDVSVCEAANLTLPTGLTLPTASALGDPSDSTSAIGIGAKPTVTSAARVIHGEVKY